jgi:hypothetical protein
MIALPADVQLQKGQWFVTHHDPTTRGDAKHGVDDRPADATIRAEVDHDRPSERAGFREREQETRAGERRAVHRGIDRDCRNRVAERGRGVDHH